MPVCRLPVVPGEHSWQNEGFLTWMHWLKPHRRLRPSSQQSKVTSRHLWHPRSCTHVCNTPLLSAVCMPTQVCADMCPVSVGLCTPVCPGIGNRTNKSLDVVSYAHSFNLYLLLLLLAVAAGDGTVRKVPWVKLLLKVCMTSDSCCCNYVFT